jgi:uncharacterized protein
MYLVDTNIWLEYLLNQARAQESRQFLAAFDGLRYSISDFSLHSVGVILGRRQRCNVLDPFVTDLLIQGQVSLRTVPAPQMLAVTAAMQAQRLDFDDAYQYVIAKRDQLTLVSFDADFDRTDLPRLTAADRTFAAARH